MIGMSGLVLHYDYLYRNDPSGAPNEYTLSNESSLNEAVDIPANSSRDVLVNAPLGFVDAAAPRQVPRYVVLNLDYGLPDGVSIQHLAHYPNNGESLLEITFRNSTGSSQQVDIMVNLLMATDIIRP